MRFPISSSLITAVLTVTAAATAGAETTLKAKHSGKCAQVNGASAQNGAAVTQWDCVDQDNVKWNLQDVGGGYYFIKAKHSGKCLQVNGAVTTNGGAVTQWDCVDQDNVKWAMKDAEAGFVYLKAKHSGKCLQVNGGSSQNGAKITQWDCVNQDNVKWRVDGEAASSEPEAPVRVADVRSIALPAGEAQSTVVPPGKKTAQCKAGRFLVSLDGRRPPDDVVVGRDLDQASGPPVVSDFKMGSLAPNVGNYQFGTNDHDLVTLSNGDVLYVTGAFSRMALTKPPGWFPITFRGNFGPGARYVVLTWRSTDCGQTFEFVGEFDPLKSLEPSCTLPQYRLIDKNTCDWKTSDCRIFEKPYDMGGSDGQLTMVGPGDRLYMTYPCVGYTHDTSAADFTLTKTPLDKTLVLTSDDAGASWKRLGTADTRWWRFGIVPLEDDKIALGFSNYLTFGAKPAMSGGVISPPHKFTAAQPAPGGSFGWDEKTFTDNPAIPTALIGVNVWATTIVARVPNTKNVLIAYPSSFPGKGHGYRLYFHDRSNGTFGEGSAILPTKASNDSFIMHLAAVDLGSGPVLLYWYDVDGKAGTATVRGRVVTGDGFHTVDFAVSRAGGNPRSFNLVKPPGDAPFYGDYLTAGGHAGAAGAPKLGLATGAKELTYAFYPMWVESTAAGNVVRYTSVEFDTSTGGLTQPGMIEVPRSKYKQGPPSTELSKVQFLEGDLKILRDYGKKRLGTKRAVAGN